MALPGILLVLLLSSGSVPAGDQPDDANALREKILTETRLIAHSDIDMPSTEFKDDGDPNTLEVVFLTRKSEGPSRVSADGEVVFLYRASAKVQEQLIGKAFELRIEKTLGNR
jgi:hypothetical protein